MTGSYIDNRPFRHCGYTWVMTAVLCQVEIKKFLLAPLKRTYCHRCYVCRSYNSVVHFIDMSLYMCYHQIANTSNLVDVTIGAGNALPSGGYKFKPYLSAI